MTVIASAIINRVRTQLIDVGANGATLRWADAELLNWLSDGQRTLVAAIPRASAKLAVVSLVAGTRQAIPADGYCFLTSYRNMGTSGSTPGVATKKIEREVLDSQYPTWHSDTGSAVVAAFTFDMSDRLAFYVYPQSLGTSKLEILYSTMPPDLVALTDALVVSDIYETALTDYVLNRAHLKDSDYAAGAQLAAGYLQSFMAFLAATGGGDAITQATQTGRT